MKVNFFNDENTTILINNYQLEQLELDSKEELEHYFRKIFIKLRKCYNLELYGYYNIVLYQDKNYGVVIDMKKEDLDYYDYFDKEIDMRIVIDKNNFFLYKIEDYFTLDKDILNISSLYKYKNDMYLKLNKELDFIKQGSLMECSELVYKNTNSIINCGKMCHMKDSK